MAVLYISEYNRLGTDYNGQAVLAGMEPNSRTTIVQITGQSQQSDVFGSSTTFVELHPDATCSVKFGSDPVATTADKRVVANERIYYPLAPGQRLRVAVIANV
jgi:hypothetical protein